MGGRTIMWPFKKQRNFIRIGRAILKLQEIKEIIMVTAPGAGKDTAVAPFKLKICMKYADNIEIEYESWDERQHVFDDLWGMVKDL